ncbi:PD-(D/E)XK nuclease family protein [filamentous cyanobacterium LEGE 11480]|uniref:PD-(D/E)XK nuclease family protein n=1 Tax=Romeriopsis navalis LEGE 11480 TaxID=2777977 RepID=A0A928VLZ3_9CYAN|nr:PD-(D/E)XK nuclease family protein [Romeriopsis navalis]MBE9031063.1 PD-(D/E)XK nuclease family protein [Romeriopsis navalis LEGE 11480]
MVYPISATKLRTYQRCAYSYYLRYEKRVKNNEYFAAAVLGTALHKTLAQCHRDWHYHDAVPDRRWFHRCWKEKSQGMTLQQIREGKAILDTYYDRYIGVEDVLRKPLAVEGKIQATLEVQNLEFQIGGRYDRIDFLPDGLELIDYKSAKIMQLPDPQDLDLQIGLYYLALEQTYGEQLKYLSLLFLRTGEKVQYRATQRHKRLAKRTISQLATQLRQEDSWQPTPGEHCSQCSFSRYCAAVSREPNPLPAKNAAVKRGLQLTFGLEAS